MRLRCATGPRFERLSAHLRHVFLPYQTRLFPPLKYVGNLSVLPRIFAARANFYAAHLISSSVLALRAASKAVIACRPCSVTR